MSIPAPPGWARPVLPAEGHHLSNGVFPPLSAQGLHLSRNISTRKRKFFSSAVCDIKQVDGCCANLVFLVCFYSKLTWRADRPSLSHPIVFCAHFLLKISADASGGKKSLVQPRSSRLQPTFYHILARFSRRTLSFYLSF